MLRLARLCDALSLWLAVIGVTTVVVVASARPASGPDRPSPTERAHRCHPECRFYSHSAAGLAAYEADLRVMAELGCIEAPGLGE